MTSPDLASSPDHDPELTQFLEQVTELSASRDALGPDAFLSQLDELAAQFALLRKYRKDANLAARLESFAVHRFELVDDPSEYVLAGNEVSLLSMVLTDAAPLVLPALKRSVSIVSLVLSEPGVPRLFGQLLKRLRTLARQQKDEELERWVAGVISALPGD